MDSRPSHTRGGATYPRAPPPTELTQPKRAQRCGILRAVHTFKDEHQSPPPELVPQLKTGPARRARARGYPGTSSRGAKTHRLSRARGPPEAVGPGLKKGPCQAGGPEQRRAGHILPGLKPRGSPDRGGPTPVKAAPDNQARAGMKRAPTGPSARHSEKMRVGAASPGVCAWPLPPAF